MTKEEKDLLLKDFCSRLPYGVKVYYKISDKDSPIIETLSGHMLDYFNENCIVEVRPYLRPMLSMTEKEAEQFEFISEELLSEAGSEEIWNTVIDWLNEHHFDHRHLIEKGLALEALEGMYNI